MKKLPQQIFVALENPDTDEEFLDARSERDELVAMGETKEIGEYVLRRRIEIKGMAEELREIG